MPKRHTVKNLYDILGVPKTATQDEIKKAFREKAKILHPDTVIDGAEKKRLEEQFKELNEAYSILSDADKKASYDNPPNNFQGSFNPFGDSNMDEFVRQMFGQQRGGNPFFHFNFGQGTANSHVHVNMETVVNQNANVSCFDLMLGTTLQVNCPSGTKKTIRIPPGTQNGTIFRITDKHNNATLHIHLRIVATIPILTPEQMEKLKTLLDVKAETPA